MRVVGQDVRSSFSQCDYVFIETQQRFQSPMKTILAPIDFSSISRRLITEAIELARALKARVVLLHSVPPAPILSTDLPPVASAVLSFMGDAEKAAARHLRRIQRERNTHGVSIDSISTNGFPAPQILAWAKKLRASYIVVGSQGHTAFYDLVAGSTASGVLKRATCPVVVVPARKKGKSRRMNRR